MPHPMHVLPRPPQHTFAKISHRGIFIERQLQAGGTYRYICHTGIDKFLPDLYDDQAQAIAAVDAKLGRRGATFDQKFWDRLAARLWCSVELVKRTTYMMAYGGSVDPWLNHLICTEIVALEQESP